MKKQVCSIILLFLIIISSVESQTCNPSGKIRGIKPPPNQCNQEHDSDCCVQGKLYTTYKCSPKVTGRTKATLTINSFAAGGDGGGPSACDNKYHPDSEPVVALSTGPLISCNPSGKIRGIKPPPNQCNQEHDSDCCVQGKLYTTYKCSPKVTGRTKATLTINSFAAGGDGGGPSACDNKYHPDSEPVVALSTGWFNNESRCMKYINIYGNGKSTRAKVVDECDSTMGCDKEHDYQPPCPNNIVDASEAVWKALGISDPDDVGSLDIYWSDV